MLDVPTPAQKAAAKELSTKKVVTTHVRIPLWGPFVLFATYPIIAFIRGPSRRWRRRWRGLCVKCGYNLSRLAEPRCPECGTEIEEVS